MVFIEELRRRWTWLVAVVIIVALGLGFAARVQAGERAAAPVYSAVELTDAILFADGPAARQLAGLERPKIEWTEEARRSREAIDGAVAKDQDWGKSFADRIQSGDPNRITPALQELSGVARTAMDGLWGRDTVDKAMESVVSGSVSGTVLVWQQYVFIYRIFAVARYIWLIWSASFKDRYETGNLPDELTIRTIAENLNARA